jgi:hypothetical protein
LEWHIPLRDLNQIVPFGYEGILVSYRFVLRWPWFNPAGLQQILRIIEDSVRVPELVDLDVQLVQ